MYNEGISQTGDLLDTAVKYEIVGKSGNSYSFNSEKLGTGRENAKLYLKENPKIAKEILKSVFQKVKE